MSTLDTYADVATRHAAYGLLWQATDASENGGAGFPIGDADEGGVEGNLTYVEATADLIRDDVTRFVTDNYDLLVHAGVTAEMAGHDFVLTANHHGAGFWDRGLGGAGELLTEATHAVSHGLEAEFELWGGRDSQPMNVCDDELCWLMVENTVLLDLIGASADA
jgi:hypothetical protein